MKWIVFTVIIALIIAIIIFTVFLWGPSFDAFMSKIMFNGFAILIYFIVCCFVCYKIAERNTW